MKISFIAENDFANVLTEYSYCLNKHSKDIESKSICFRKHPFNYDIQHDYDLEANDKIQIEESKKFLLESDVIIFAEESWEGQQPNSTYKTISKFSSIYGFDLFELEAKFCIWHPGSCYREIYPFYNNHPQRDKIHRHFYAIDLYRLSPKNKNDSPLIPYQYYDFNYNNFILNFKKKLNTSPWTILHIPSKAPIKGTSTFERIIKILDLNPELFNYRVLQNIPYSQVIKEKEKSVFYLDQVNDNGGYGLASLEAIYLSNLTFSTVDFIADSMLKLTGKYECPVIPIENNEKKLVEILENYIKNTTKKDLISYMEGIGHWIEKHNSPKSIVKQFMELI